MSSPEPKILYVDDDVKSRKVLAVLIKNVLGYPDLTIFEDSSNFLDRVHALAGVPNVIFLDIQIGPHDGYEMLNMLRSDSLYQNTTVVAMTANVMSNDVDELKRAGFSGLIGKPIMMDIFPELVEKLLAGESVWYIP